MDTGPATGFQGVLPSCEHRSAGIIDHDPIHHSTKQRKVAKLGTARWNREQSVSMAANGHTNGTNVNGNHEMEDDTFLFTSESVNEGHPDKLCDQASARQAVHVLPPCGAAF